MKTGLALQFRVQTQSETLRRPSHGWQYPADGPGTQDLVGDRAWRASGAAGFGVVVARCRSSLVVDHGRPVLQFGDTGTLEGLVRNRRPRGRADGTPGAVRLVAMVPRQGGPLGAGVDAAGLWLRAQPVDVCAPGAGAVEIHGATGQSRDGPPLAASGAAGLAASAAGAGTGRPAACGETGTHSPSAEASAGQRSRAVPGRGGRQQQPQDRRHVDAPRTTGQRHHAGDERESLCGRQPELVHRDPHRHPRRATKPLAVSEASGRSVLPPATVPGDSCDLRQREVPRASSALHRRSSCSSLRMVFRSRLSSEWSTRMPKTGGSNSPQNSGG